MRIWKLLGIAGLVGVAATGAAVARSERKRRAYTSEEVHDRLRKRAAALDSADSADGAGAPTDDDETRLDQR
ncbi:MAG TPA: hypothetical protein VFR46_02870 [Actinomycetes bacterium]|nr:hypothetical protein [Actinomycetes bacterium]